MLVVMHVQQLEVQINLDQVLVLLVVAQVKFDHNKASFLLSVLAQLVVVKDRQLKIHV